MADGSFKKMMFTVLGPELFLAPPVALGAVYVSAGTKPVKTIQAFISKHIVEPHLEWFESRAGSLKQAHDNYDKKKREAMEARGEPVPPANVSVITRQERADIISSVLTKGSIVMAADTLTTLGAQQAIAGAMKQPMHWGVAFAEAAVHLCGVAFMSGPGAARGEDMHYWIKHQLESKGVSETKADDLGTAIPYIILPGYAASLASLGGAEAYRRLKTAKTSVSHIER